MAASTTLPAPSRDRTVEEIEESIAAARAHADKVARSLVRNLLPIAGRPGPHVAWKRG